MAIDGSGRVLWSRQPGTSDTDHAYAVATNGDGNVYVVGWTSGALGGANKGGADGWVIKFAGDGRRRLWIRQPGSSTVVGDTGEIPDDVASPPDAWVIKFAGNGRRLWSRQPGTSGEDHLYAVATDKDGNVYVVGGTHGALACTAPRL